MVDDNVEYQEVDSSNLHSVGYDAENGVLFVIFKNEETGAPTSKYWYGDVPAAVYAELMTAESKGKYHARYIKGKYSYGRLPL